MIHRLTVADLINLPTLGLLARSNVAVTRERLGAGAAGVRWMAGNFRPRVGRQTHRAVWVGFAGGTPTGVAAARKRCGPRAWEIEDLAYRSFASETGVELLEGAAAHVAQCGAERLFLRVAEDSEADLVAQQAGFTPSFQEHLYIRSRRSTGNGSVDGVALREAGPQDEHGLFQLYNAATPAEVRATRALTLSQWQDSREDSAGRVTELVWLDGDRLIASARYSRSAIGVHLEIVALPNVGGRMDGFLATLLRRVNARRMLRCLAPDYAPELGRTLEAWGFRRSAGYRVWVRAIASPVLAPGLAPARA